MPPRPAGMLLPAEAASAAARREARKLVNPAPRASTRVNKIEGKSVDRGGRGGRLELALALPLFCSNILEMVGGVMRWATVLAPDQAIRAGQRNACQQDRTALPESLPPS